MRVSGLVVIASSQESEVLVSVIIYEAVINSFSPSSASLVRDRQGLLPFKILSFFNEDIFTYDNWEGVTDRNYEGH